MPIDRQPLGIADWARCCQIGAQSFSQSFGQSNIVLALYATANGHNNLRFAEIDRGLNFLKRRFRFHANFADVHRNLFYRCTASLRGLLRTKRAGLKGDEDGRRAIRNNVGIQLSQKYSPRECDLAGARIHANAVADQPLAKTRGHFRRKVAHQISVGHDNVLRIRRAHDLFHCRRVRIRSVVGQPGVIRIDDLR